MKRVASPRGWPKKVFSVPGVPGLTESFVRLDAMVVPRGSGRVSAKVHAPGGGSRHRRAVPSTPRPGESAPFLLAADGDHRDPRLPHGDARDRPGNRAFPPGPAGTGPGPGPRRKE